MTHFDSLLNVGYSNGPLLPPNIVKLLPNLIWRFKPMLMESDLTFNFNFNFKLIVKVEHFSCNLEIGALTRYHNQISHNCDQMTTEYNSWGLIDIREVISEIQLQLQLQIRR